MSKPRQRKFTRPEVEAAMQKLFKMVEDAAGNSAFEGIRFLCICFAGMLDVYAQPNPNNPQGMVDDPAQLRAIAAQIIIDTPTLRKKPH